jgi:hypothetical protein
MDSSKSNIKRSHSFTANNPGGPPRRSNHRSSLVVDIDGMFKSSSPVKDDELNQSVSLEVNRIVNAFGNDVSPILIRKSVQQTLEKKDDTPSKQDIDTVLKQQNDKAKDIPLKQDKDGPLKQDKNTPLNQDKDGPLKQDKVP